MTAELRVEQHPGDGGVAGEALNGGVGDRGAAVQLGTGGAGQALEGGKRGGDLEVGALAGARRHVALVEPVSGQLDQRIGEPLCPVAVLVGTTPPRQRLESGTQEASTLGVEEAGNGQATSFRGAETQASPLDGVDRTRHARSRMHRVLRVVAGGAEAGDGVAFGGGKQGALVEVLGDRAARCKVGGLSHQAEVREADAPVEEGVDARRQVTLPLAHLQGGDRRVAGHPAFLANPGGRVLVEVGVRRGSEPVRDARKGQLEAVDDGAGAAEILPEIVARAGLAG